jgi:hypothetical protein
MVSALVSALEQNARCYSLICAITIVSVSGPFGLGGGLPEIKVLQQI